MTTASQSTFEGTTAGTAPYMYLSVFHDFGGLLFLAHAIFISDIYIFQQQGVTNLLLNRQDLITIYRPIWVLLPGVGGGGQK